MTELFGGEIGWVIVKALLLYATAVVGFRLGDRRTLTQMTPFDFVAAVAVGAIVGRVPNAETTSYLAGAATLVTILIAHRLLVRLHYIPSVAQLLERSPRIVISDGEVIDAELRRCGLTLSELYAQLRQQSISDLREVRYAIIEQRGQLSIIRQEDPAWSPPPLVRDALERAGQPS